MRLPPMEELPPPLRGQTVVHLRYAYSGEDLAQGERLVEPMKAAGRIVLGFIGPIRTSEMDSIHMDPVDPMPAWEKGMLLAELTEGTVDALLAAAGPQLDIPLIMVEIRLMGGALGRPAASPERGRRPGGCLLGATSSARRSRSSPRSCRRSARASSGRSAPWKSPVNMINFLGDVSGPDEVAAAYPAGTFERLREVKRSVDPAGVFSFGHAF